MKPRLPFSTRTRMALGLVGLVGVTVALAGRGEGDPVTIEIPSGATSQGVASVLEEYGVIGSARLFHTYVRIRRADRDLKAGTYQMRTRSSMRQALRQLSRGEVETIAVTVPEGLAFWQLAPILAEVTGSTEEAIAAALRDADLAERHGVPGPTIEGYLFPDTYRFARGVPLETVIEAMVARYRAVWTEERRAALRASTLDERGIVTLASIIQTEARRVTEMPRISGVYHNRIREGWLLQADPTVIYALGGYRERLLYAAIDSVADDPYNTYTQRGLPPGPIASPGERAIDAALAPERHDFWYFVARPDGYHVFTQTLRDHNRAKEEQQAARDGA